MRFVFILALLFAYALAQESVLAIAHIRSTSNASSDIDGTVTFEEFFDNDIQLVQMTVELTGINTTAPALGIHLHSYADMTDTSGSAFGGHWVGTGTDNHGCPENSGVDRHEGDTGNWIVENGTISQVKNLDLLTLSGSTSVIGRGVILHDLEDPCDDTPTGARIAMGPIGIANAESNTAAQGESENILVCNIQGTDSCPLCAGTVWFESMAEGVRVTARVEGLDNEPHAFHLHEFGDLTDSSAGTSCGGHYNPDDSDHDLPITEQRHEGDMGIIQSFDGEGVGWYEYINTRFSSTANIAGRGVVIHELTDHGAGYGCVNGGSGSRFAICVVSIAEDTTVIPSPPIAVNNDYTEIDCETPPTDGDDDANETEDDTMLYIIIAVSIAVALLLIVIIAIGASFFVYKKRAKAYKEAENRSGFDQSLEDDDDLF